MYVVTAICGFRLSAWLFGFDGLRYRRGSIFWVAVLEISGFRVAMGYFACGSPFDGDFVWFGLFSWLFRWACLGRTFSSI